MKRVIVEIIIAGALAVVGLLLLWGANFASNMVHDQLADQKITFPTADKMSAEEKAEPNLQTYAGQQLLDGAQAKVYADEYIKLHLSEVNNGKTYSETSNDSRAAAAKAKAATEAKAPDADQLNADAKALDGKVQTLFRGETLRGLLLYAWGWWLVGRIAFWVGIFLIVCAVALLIAAIATRPHHPAKTPDAATA